MDRIGPDILVSILRHTPLGFIACVCRLVCKEWCAVISTGRAPLFWRRPIYADFRRDIAPFPAFYRALLADGTWTIDFAWEAKRLLFSDKTQKFIVDEGFATDAQVTRLSLGAFFTYNLVAMREGLIHIDDIMNITGTVLEVVRFMRMLDQTADRSHAALREKLFTFRELCHFATHIDRLYSLFDRNGYCLTALREGFITLSMLESVDLLCCASRPALTAIREGWFPWEELLNYSIENYTLCQIFSVDTTLSNVIRNGIVKWSDIIQLGVLRCNVLIERPEIVEALVEQLFTVDDLAAVPSGYLAEAFYYPYVRSLIRSGHITLRDIAGLESARDIGPFLRSALRKKIKLD